MTGIKTRTQTQEQKELYKQHIADKADCTNLVTYMSAYNKAEREQNNVEKIQAAMLKKWARFQGIGNRDDSLPPPRDIAGKIHFAYLVSKSEAGRRNTNKNSFYIESGSQGAILFKGRNYPDCLFTPEGTGKTNTTSTSQVKMMRTSIKKKKFMNWRSRAPTSTPKNNGR